VPGSTEWQPTAAQARRGGCVSPIGELLLSKRIPARSFSFSQTGADIQGFVDRGGKGRRDPRPRSGKYLMFTWWHRVRDGTLLRQTFQRRMEPVKGEVLRLLRAGPVEWRIRSSSSLFTFVCEPDVEPTNDVSERRVRAAVIARKLSFGTESPEGSRCIERVLAVTTMLNRKGRNILENMVAAHQAHLHGRQAPSLPAVNYLRTGVCERV